MIKNLLILILVIIFLFGCANVHYPSRSFSFTNKRNVYGNDESTIFTEYFGKEDIWLKIIYPGANNFMYGINASFLVNEQQMNTAVTIYKVIINHKEYSYTLLNTKETFIISDSIPKYYPEKILNGKWYADLRYSTDLQKRKYSTNGIFQVTIIPPTDFLEIFKYEKIGEEFPITLSVIYQLDQNEVRTHTSYFTVNVNKGRYYSLFDIMSI